jgi:hypothetical protein
MLYRCWKVEDEAQVESKDNKNTIYLLLIDFVFVFVCLLPIATGRLSILINATTLLIKHTSTVVSALVESAQN